MAAKCVKELKRYIDPDSGKCEGHPKHYAKAKYELCQDCGFTSDKGFRAWCAGRRCMARAPPATLANQLQVEEECILLRDSFSNAP